MEKGINYFAAGWPCSIPSPSRAGCILGFAVENGAENARLIIENRKRMERHVWHNLVFCRPCIQYGNPYSFLAVDRVRVPSTSAIKYLGGDCGVGVQCSILQ